MTGDFYVNFRGENMRVPIKWLKQYVDFEWQPEQLAHNLTMAGIAVEGLEKIDSDIVLDLDLTPNRGDCLGLINLAREVAALTGSEIRIPKINLRESDKNISDYIAVEIAAPDLCRRYAARIIRNCTVKPSPAWLQEVLLSAGIRPINNIVDVTNYVMLETNQPLHAFDYDLLGKGKRVLVRKAAAGERIVTLDGIERKLDEEMLLITDGSRGIALAGIMGGENTEINENTSCVLLESANFLATNIRQTSRKLGLRSDSSVRFEKGVDVNGVIYAINRAAQLIQQLAGGEIFKGVCDVYPEIQVPVQVILRPDRVNYLLGTDLSPEEIKNYLRNLKFDVKEKGEQFIVDIPSYRPDITIEADLIEEVARLYGYDKIPASLPCIDITPAGLNSYQKLRDEVKSIMAQNLFEVINYSFINPKFFDMLLLPQNSDLRRTVKLSNPLSEEQSVMRTTLLPGLLENISRNLARRNLDLAFYEMGAVFYPVDEGLPSEKLHIGAAITGNTKVNWLKKTVEMDFFYLKGILEYLLAKLGMRDCEFVQVSRPSFHPGRTAAVIYKGEEIGVIGEMHPLVLQNFDIKQRTCMFELDLGKIFKLCGRKTMMEEIAKFPAVERDIAVLLAEDVDASDAVRVIRETEGELLREVVVFDVYKGEQVAEGYKSIAFKLTLQSSEKTLTEDEINRIIQDVLDNLKKELQAELR